jgi:hypothetical protein
VQTELEIVRTALGTLAATVAASPTAALGTGSAPSRVAQLIADARTQLNADVTGKLLRRRLGVVARDVASVERIVRSGLRRHTTQCDPGLRLLDLTRGTRDHVRRALGGHARPAAIVPSVTEAKPLPVDPRTLAAE